MTNFKITSFFYRIHNPFMLYLLFAITVINKALNWAHQLLEAYKIKLPNFGYWTLDDWKSKAESTPIIREVMLGWDITDYGMNDFDNFGAVLFTLRNGSLKDASVGAPYAEKLLLLKDGQRLPNHYHAS